jgi:membrane-associated phospholipid phosphatase
MNIRTLALALVLTAGTARAQAPERPALFTRQDAAWAGAVLLGSVALSRADVHIIRVWTDSANHDPGRDQVARAFAKLQEGTLTLGNLALWGIGRLTGSHGLADVSFHAAEAVFVGSVAAQMIRGPLGRARPYATNYEDQYEFHPFQGFTNFKYRAFPSIHTSSAFAVATVYTLETQRRHPGATWIVGPIAYAIAAGPGLARLYNGQHWASDIVAGAFLGTMAGAKVVKYNHDIAPHNRVNRFFLGARNVQVGLGDGALSARFATTF